jgi:hypothetical protein
MTYNTQYVTLPGDKAAHIIGDGQRTACGEVLPYASDWTTEPDGKVCADCTARLKKDAEAVSPAVEPEAEPEPANEAPKGKAKSAAKA